MRLIDADALGNRMYHESFEKDSDLQRWDGGYWIRYKLFEQVLRAAPTIDLTRPTPSNTLGALDCIDRQEAIKALCREECGMDPKGCCVGTCYDVEIIEDVPSVQLELSNNSPELDKEIGECNDCIKHGGDWECDRVHCHKGDAISRQAAIDALQKEINKGIPPFDDVMGSIRCGVRLARNIIEDLPSAQPRKGKWLKAYGDHEAFGVRPFYYYCSECNKLTFFPYDFCPNCGCRMEEGDFE